MMSRGKIYIVVGLYFGEENADAKALADGGSVLPGLGDVVAKTIAAASTSA